MGRRSLIVVLDNVRSALNVGSIFRTCDAFAIKKMVLCGITANPPHREISKTALGAELSVPWIKEKDVLESVLLLKEQGCYVVSAEESETSENISELNLPSTGDVVLVFGNEVNGIKKSVLEISDDVVQIPQCGSKQSLNVGVAVGIVLWHVANLR